MNETVRLLQCYHCGRLQYPSDRYTGHGCKCGSIHARLAPPTFINRVKFIWHEVPGIFNKVRELVAMEVVK